MARDITELDTSRKKIRQMAFYDSLTGLPNRTLFNEQLREMIRDAASAGQRAGVMLIDMDHFKAVNDTMGHPVGDELLRQVATRLREGVRTTDTVANSVAMSLLSCFRMLRTLRIWLKLPAECSPHSENVSCFPTGSSLYPAVLGYRYFQMTATHPTIW